MHIFSKWVFSVLLELVLPAMQVLHCALCERRERERVFLLPMYMYLILTQTFTHADLKNYYYVLVDHKDPVRMLSRKIFVEYVATKLIIPNTSPITFGYGKIYLHMHEQAIKHYELLWVGTSLLHIVDSCFWSNVFYLRAIMVNPVIVTSSYWVRKSTLEKSLNKSTERSLIDYCCICSDFH